MQEELYFSSGYVSQIKIHMFLPLFCSENGDPDYEKCDVNCLISMVLAARTVKVEPFHPNKYDRRNTNGGVQAVRVRQLICGYSNVCNAQSSAHVHVLQKHVKHPSLGCTKGLPDPNQLFV
jgi:hypothetical protein